MYLQTLLSVVLILVMQSIFLYFLCSKTKYFNSHEYEFDIINGLIPSQSLGLYYYGYRNSGTLTLCEEILCCCCCWNPEFVTSGCAAVPELTELCCFLVQDGIVAPR